VFDEPAADPIAALKRRCCAGVRGGTGRTGPGSTGSRAQQTQTPTGWEASATRQFTGTPVSLDFDGSDLRAVLTALAKEGGINVYIDPRVQGTSRPASSTSVGRGFDLIASANGLGTAARLSGPCRTAGVPADEKPSGESRRRARACGELGR
jgi:hypothetical protein